MTAFKTKWLDWTPEATPEEPPKANNVSFGSGSPRRIQPRVGLNKQTNTDKQTNVITDYSPKRVSVGKGLYTHRGGTDKAANNQGWDPADSRQTDDEKYGEICGIRYNRSRGDWDPEMTRLIEWFLATPPPTEPFEMNPAVTIIHAGRYWEYLRGDIAAGPGRQRSYMGAFEEDLRRLYELFGPGSNHATVDGEASAGQRGDEEPVDEPLVELPEEPPDEPDHFVDVTEALRGGETEVEDGELVVDDELPAEPPDEPGLGTPPTYDELPEEPPDDLWEEDVNPFDHEEEEQ